MSAEPCPADRAPNAVSGYGTGQPLHGPGHVDFQTLLGALMVQAQAIDHLAQSISELAQAIGSEGDDGNDGPTAYLNGQPVR